MLPLPEVLVAQATDKFDADGDLTDEATGAAIRDLLVALAAWTRRLALTERLAS